MEFSKLSVGAGSVAFALAPALARAQTPSEPWRHGYGPHMMDWGGGWFGMMFGSLSMILVLGAVVAIVVLLVRWLGGPVHGGVLPHHHAPPTRTPLDILKERFARGEIDKEEFEDRRRTLGE